MIRLLTFAVATLLALALAMPARAAGPTFTVPGAINAGNLVTGVACTNNNTSAGTLEVFFYENSGTQAGHVGPVSLAVGQTYMVTSNPTFGIGPDSVASASGFSRGSVHILATAAVGCTAFVADSSSNPPASMMTLPVLKGIKQKGD